MENVHTYAHARHVRNAPRCNSLHHQTFLWPTSQPPPSHPDFTYQPSEFGPPVRTVEDLIAYNYLLQHRPDVFKLSTSSVLDSVSDREFDSYEARKKNETTRKFREKYSSYTSQFDREVSRQSTSNTSQKSKKKIKTPKRSKFFDDLTSESLNTWRTLPTSSQVIEDIPVYYSEEIILPPCSQSIIEHELILEVQYSTVSQLLQPQRATITVEVKDEYQDRSSCRQQDSGDLWSNLVIGIDHWSKRKTRVYSPSFKRKVKLFIASCRWKRTIGTNEDATRLNNLVFASKFRPSNLKVIRNFKKRRRKCESEHAY